MTGETIAHYILGKKLGAGGMGEVYRARDSRLGRDVALKLLPPEAVADSVARARLVEEARTASALNHPHICTIFEVGEAGGRTYVAMELVEGRPLAAMIPPEGLPGEAVLRYGAQIADALAHAHTRGVVHRDMKSANVIITPEGRAKVLDFGLARRLADDELAEATRSQLTGSAAGAVAGTLAYMPPEVLQGETADARRDLWSLGVMLFEMAAGQLPFRGRTGFELSSAILRESPATLPPEVSPALRAIILRCLAKQPGERYQSAGEVRAALEAIGSTTAQPAVVAATVPPKRHWIVRAAAVAGAVFVLFFMTRLVGVLFEVREPAAPAAEKRLTMGAIPSANAEANEYLEKGIMLLISQNEVFRGRQMFERALEIDPNFAEARAWRGFTFFLELDGGLSNDTGLLDLAEQEMRQAIAQDPRVSRAYSGLAAVYFTQGRKDLMAAPARKAIELNPDDPDARHWLMHYHRLNGDTEKALALNLENLQRNHLFWPARMMLASLYYVSGDDQAAIREYQKNLEQIPHHSYSLRGLARIYLGRGELRQARAALEKLRPEDRKRNNVRITEATLLALEGRTAAARALLDPEMLRFLETSPPFAEDAVQLYAVLGEKEKALDWLHRAVRTGDERAEWFQRDPLLAHIRGEPRFQQILDSIAFRRQQRSISPER